uniref:Calmodulin n=1 Tax=Globodera rostochiensis TaxID=31243 RepID=A0A914H181_GLORO
MGNSASATVSPDEWDDLHLESGLSKRSLKTLHNRFLELAQQKDDNGIEFMCRADFESIPDLLKNPLGSRLIDVFFVNADVGDQKRVYFRNFVKVLSHFRPINKHSPHPWNSREAKLQFAFTMYDLNRSGTITKDEFTEILIRMIGGNVSRAKVDAIAERTMLEADRNADGSITFEEFCRAMEKTDIEEKMSFQFLI